MSSKLPYILGGAAVLGIGYFLYKKSQTPTATGAKSTAGTPQGSAGTPQGAAGTPQGPAAPEPTRPILVRSPGPLNTNAIRLRPELFATQPEPAPQPEPQPKPEPEPQPKPEPEPQPQEPVDTADLDACSQAVEDISNSTLRMAVKAGISQAAKLGGPKGASELQTAISALRMAAFLDDSMTDIADCLQAAADKMK
jgi:hypothetical protein